jgi:hypothetical protein
MSFYKYREGWSIFFPVTLIELQFFPTVTLMVYIGNDTLNFRGRKRKKSAIEVGGTV